MAHAPAALTGRLVDSTFRPAWWLPGPHLQTLWASEVRRRPRTQLNRQRLELTDGDFIDLDHTTSATGTAQVLVLHGLEGSSESNYAAGILNALSASGLHAVLMHFRGCSGQANRLARSYHSGETGDLQFVVDHLRRRDPASKLFVIGYSLGGNVLLKWLGERGETAEVDGAVAVSVPFRLADCAERLQHGFSRLYQWRLIRSLRRRYRSKFGSVDNGPIPCAELQGIRSFWSFDDRITAPLHGFSGVDEYYRTSSSRQYLARIRKPVLILQARDDPFMTPDVVPLASELASDTVLELADAGGHVGFVSGRFPWQPRYWLEQRIVRYLKQHC